MSFINSYTEFSRTDFFDGLFSVSPSFNSQALLTYLSGLITSSVPSTSSIQGTGSEIGLIQAINDIYDPVQLAYISSLIYEVEPPKDILDTDDIDFGIFKINFPKGYKALPFAVTFIDDSDNTIQQWYQEYQGLIVRSDATFALFSQIAISFTLIKESSLSLNAFGVPIETNEVPRALDIYPQVFPVSMEEPSYSRSKGDFRMIKITFNRLIQINMPIPSYSGKYKKPDPHITSPSFF